MSTDDAHLIHRPDELGRLLDGTDAYPPHDRDHLAAGVLIDLATGREPWAVGLLEDLTADALARERARRVATEGAPPLAVRESVPNGSNTTKADTTIDTESDRA